MKKTFSLTFKNNLDFVLVDLITRYSESTLILKNEYLLDTHGIRGGMENEIDKKANALS